MNDCRRQYSATKLLCRRRVKGKSNCSLIRATAVLDRQLGWTGRRSPPPNPKFLSALVAKFVTGLEEVTAAVYVVIEFVVGLQGRSRKTVIGRRHLVEDVVRIG